MPLDLMPQDLMPREQSSPARPTPRAISLLALSLAAVLYPCAAAQTAPAPAAAAAAAVPAQSPPMNGIAHIAIRVKDLAASVAFYNKLGFQQAFAVTRGDATTQSFIKLNDKQFIEIYPMSAQNPTQSTPGFMHLCFEGADLNALHDYYAAEGLAPAPLRKAGAGNLLFTLRGPQQPDFAQNIEYTEYMPGSLHTNDAGQHLGPDRVADKMVAVTLAMQGPAAARDFYLTKLGFTPDSNAEGGHNFLVLPGSSGEAIEIVPAARLGAKSSILMTSPDIHKSGELLKAKGIDFSDGDTLTVTDPDGNTIQIIPQAGTFHGPSM